MRDFEVLDGGQAAADRRFPARSRGRQRRAAVRRERQHGRRSSPNAREAATHVLSWLDATRDEAAVFTFDTRLDEVVPFTTGLKSAARRRWRRSCRSARRRCTTRSRGRRERVGAREGRRRAVVVFTDGNDNASRLTPAEVSAIASAIDVPVYIFGIVPSIDNPAADIATPSAQQLGARRAAGGSRGLDRRPRVRGEHAGAAQRRGAADRRRAAASVSHRVRIERQAGLASARGPRAQQGPDRSSPEWVHRGAISPEFVIRRIDHVAEILHGSSRRGAGGRRLDRLRDEEVRADAASAK